MVRKKDRAFLEFVDNNLNLTKPCKNDYDIVEVTKGCDVFVTGSDQVFNYLMTQDDSNYFLEFVKTGKKYSYAASFGMSEFDSRYNEKIKEWLFGRELGEPKTEYDYLFEGFGENQFYTYPVAVSTREYSGEFKDGKFHGEGKSYFGADENNQPYLVYEGKFAEGKYEGKGKEYYYDGGGLKYEGEFKNGEYHGKGTLYDEQGNEKHKGKFKSGEVE